MEPKPLSERGAAWWRAYLGLAPDAPLPPGCGEPIFDETDVFDELDDEDED